MRKSFARLLVLLLACAGLVVGAPGAVAEVDPVADGSRFLGTCMQNARSMSALFVFDQSGSLRDSDPGNVRYEGLTAALEILSGLTTPEGETIPVEVAVSAFDDQYTSASSIVGWTGLNDVSGNIDRVISDVVRDARGGTAPRGGTDFEKALGGGFSEFHDRLGSNNCRVMFWFTDGAFEYNPIGVDAARAQMCASGGLLDQIREARIVLVGMQLDTTALDLAPMSLGTWGGTQCGTQPLPEGWSPGIYLQADDASSLEEIFLGIRNIVEGCTPVGDSGQIDPGINRMRISLGGESSIGSVRLDAPSGASFTVDAQGQTEANGYVVRSQRNGNFVSMEVVLPMGAPAGQWRVSPDAPLRANGIEFCVFSDLRLERASALPQQTGTEATILLQVVDRDGNPADLTPYDRVEVPLGSITALAHGGAVRTIGTVTVDEATGRVSVPVTVELTDVILTVKARVQLVTQSGIELTPLSLDFKQALVIASNFPLVDPIEQLDLGTAVKANPAVATLQLIGSADGPTQVCLDTVTDIRVPSDAAGTTLSFPEECIDLAQGETREVTVSVTPSHPAVGDAEAVIPVRLVSAPTADRPSETASVDLQVVWRFSDPVNWWLTLVIAAIVGLISALVPIAAIGFAGWWAAKYELRGLRGVAYDVTVGPSGVTRLDPDPDLEPGALIKLREVKGLPGLDASPRRTFTFSGVTFKTKPRLNPARAPRFWAEVSPSQRIVSSTSRERGDGLTAPMTPGLGFVVIVVCALSDVGDLARSEIPGRLIVLTKNPSTDDAHLEQDVRAAITALGLDAFRRAYSGSPGGATW